MARMQRAAEAAMARVKDDEPEQVEQIEPEQVEDDNDPRALAQELSRRF